MTRNQEKDWIVGGFHDQFLSVGIRLATNSLVLKRYMFLQHQLRQQDGKGIRGTFQDVVDELKEILARANIPVKTDKRILDQLMAFYGSWKSLSKNNLERRSLPHFKCRIDAFQIKLNELCDISVSDVYQVLRSSCQPSWKEDWQFLENQRRVPQVGHMMGLDRHMQRSEKERKQTRED